MSNRPRTHRRERASKTRAALLIALVTGVSGGCRDVVAPPALPPQAEPFAALAVYQSWWRAVEECSGRSGALSRVQWFVVPQSSFFEYQGGRYNGYWWNGVHWIALASAKVDDGAVVRHEMLHDLLGRGDHPSSYFQGRCAEVVVCNEDCRAGT